VAIKRELKIINAFWINIHFWENDEDQKCAGWEVAESEHVTKYFPKIINIISKPSPENGTS
jgi:hypothetical protein